MVIFQMNLFSNAIITRVNQSTGAKLIVVRPERFSGQQTVPSAATQGDFTLPVFPTRAACRRFKTSPIGCMDMFGIEISTLGYRGAKEKIDKIDDRVRLGICVHGGKFCEFCEFSLIQLILAYFSLFQPILACFSLFPW